MTDAPKTENTVWHASDVDRADRWSAVGGRGVTVWLTGLSGSGKSSVAVELERQLIEAGRPAYLLDGDNLRHGLNGDLGFSAQDRDENVRRVGHVARLFADAGVVAIVPLISPYRKARDFARALHDAAGLPFVEVFVDTPLEICEQRDPKGLYAKARAGEITGMTGIDDPYEPPVDPERRYTPDDGTAAEVAAKLLASL
ncbi:MAG: adenylyl-sulfate kinase [Actinomycetota bacterium]